MSLTLLLCVGLTSDREIQGRRNHYLLASLLRNEQTHSSLPDELENKSYLGSIDEEQFLPDTQPANT